MDYLHIIGERRAKYLTRPSGFVTEFVIQYRDKDTEEYPGNEDLKYQDPSEQTAHVFINTTIQVLFFLFIIAHPYLDIIINNPLRKEVCRFLDQRSKECIL